MEIVSRSYNHSRSHSRSIPSHEIVAMETIVSPEIKLLLIEQIHSELRANHTTTISSSNQKKSSLWKSSLPSKIAGSKSSRPKPIANHIRSTRSLLRLGVRKIILSLSIDAVSYTHLDVYKRQLVSWPYRIIQSSQSIHFDLYRMGKYCLLYTSRCV